MELYTTEEVSNILKIDVETTRKFIQQQRIKAYKVGREWRVKGEDLRDFINRESNVK